MTACQNPRERKKILIGLCARILSAPRSVIKKFMNVSEYHLGEILYSTRDLKGRHHENHLSLKEKQS